MFQLIDMIMVRPIANTLFIIYNLVGDFGLAIILFTIIVKLCMWPIMKRQFHQTKLMRDIQPKIAEIKKQYKGNRQAQSIQTMALYKRHNIKPFRSILSLLIQLPIFIALFTAINVMVRPTEADNLATRAYSFIQTGRISDVVVKQQAVITNPSATYDFHPQLFGLVNLDAKVSDVFSDHRSISSLFIFFIALAAAFIQYRVMKQQLPSESGKTKKSFRQLMKEAAAGKQPDQSEMNTVMTSQMSKIMPITLLIIMFSLPGALVLYYFLINTINIFQQRLIFKQDQAPALSSSHASIKELNKIQEAEIITNKKTGTKITRISAKDNKKRRRK